MARVSMLVRKPPVGIRDVSSDAPILTFPLSRTGIEEKAEELSAVVQFMTRTVRATPQRLQIGVLPDDRLCLAVGLDVELEQEGPSFIANCPNIMEFGYGESPAEAIEDLQATITELYWTLKEDVDRLGGDLLDTWEELSKVIEER